MADVVADVMWVFFTIINNYYQYYYPLLLLPLLPLLLLLKCILQVLYIIVLYYYRLVAVLRADASWLWVLTSPPPQSWGAAFFPRPPRSRAYLLGRWRQCRDVSSPRVWPLPTIASLDPWWRLARRTIGIVCPPLPVDERSQPFHPTNYFSTSFLWDIRS